MHPVVPGSAARSRVEGKASAQCRGGAPKGERAPAFVLPRKRGRKGDQGRAPRRRRLARNRADRLRRTPVRMRLSALRLPSFWGRLLEGLSYRGVKQSSGAEKRRENGIAYSLLPACGEKSRSDATRMRGPLRDSERRSSAPSGEAPSSQPSPRARGEGVRKRRAKRLIFFPLQAGRGTITSPHWGRDRARRRCR